MTAIDRGRQPVPLVALALVALFVTALVTAQLTASKIIALSAPIALPLTGTTLLLPGAALAYALTFLASDCYAELYGRRAATRLVNVAFLMNFVLLGLVASTIAAPTFANSPVDGTTFATVLGASGNVVAGSLVAYLLSQNWDVYVFHWLRERTDGAHLWARNLLSTTSSQLIDTVVFVGIAFGLAPALFGVGDALPVPALLGLMLGQYVLKLVIAALDTPVVYAIVGLVRRRGPEPTPVEGSA